jgi:hypothetical protein
VSDLVEDFGGDDEYVFDAHGSFAL